MRVIGYARESSGAEDALSVFAQQEEIRRWARDQGHHLVAICQDQAGNGHHPLDRDGYLALLGSVGSGGVDAVVLPGIGSLSDDHIIQEILLWDLKERGTQVLSTDPADTAVLGDDDPGATRMLIRDVLARVEDHAQTLALNPGTTGRPIGGIEVVVELLTSLKDVAAG